MIQKKCKAEFIDLEGGFWGLISEDGENYLAMNLPEQLKTKGVLFDLTMQPLEMMGIAMWGTPVKIISFTTS